MMKKALIIQGGWDGHEPEKTSKRFGKMLADTGEWTVQIEDNLTCLENFEWLSTHDLLVACWTMGEITSEQSNNVSKAVGAGMGLAGCHGGMCDSFRQDTEWQFMTGGQWVSHPGGDNINYTVNVFPNSSPITEGISDFPVCSEQYYVHVDPAIEVLATTRFPHPDVPYYHVSNKPVDIPVAWTKFWGNGRVFYQSLGHHDDVFEKSPMAAQLMKNGLLWAGDSKQYVKEHQLTTERFENSAKMY
ncbi:hypothetical protein IGI37_001979 [Enterococcus sp. AZ194]|uniref:ThuA domain-containing protein n=1 Tax=Enterococcus sp. AZ194 TaxID=2774629 RepID=UPI003F258A10